MMIKSMVCQRVHFHYWWHIIHYRCHLQCFRWRYISCLCLTLASSISKGVKGNPLAIPAGVDSMVRAAQFLGKYVHNMTVYLYWGCCMVHAMLIHIYWYWDLYCLQTSLIWYYQYYISRCISWWVNKEREIMQSLFLVMFCTCSHLFEFNSFILYNIPGVLMEGKKKGMVLLYPYMLLFDTSQYTACLSSADEIPAAGHTLLLMGESLYKNEYWFRPYLDWLLDIYSYQVYSLIMHKIMMWLKSSTMCLH